MKNQKSKGKKRPGYLKTFLTLLILEIFFLSQLPFVRFASNGNPDVPGEQVSVKGWAGPLAGYIVEDFGINTQRMTWVEYYPAVKYGKREIKHIREKFESVEFTWSAGRAVKPRWRDLTSPLLDTVRDLVYNTKLIR